MALLALLLLWIGPAANGAAPVVTNISLLPHPAGTNHLPRPQLVILTEANQTNIIQYKTNLNQLQWLPLTNLVITANPFVWVDDQALPSAERYYRIQLLLPPPPGMALVPAGDFVMGDTFAEGFSYERPTHTVQVSAFYMDQYEVTKSRWDEIAIWAVAQGYEFSAPGAAKATNHPVHSVSWHDMVKWCNARSQKEGKTPAYYTNAELTGVYMTGQTNPLVRWDAGYRLPTEAEWEKAARGGRSGARFPWGNDITHNLANYYSSTNYAYDTSTTRGYHPLYDTNPLPYSSPVGSFAPNDYGLYDMAGNAWEWCWDWYLSTYYNSSPGVDPRGPATGTDRVRRGSSWYNLPRLIRTANRSSYPPATGYNDIGFRTVLPVPQK